VELALAFRDGAHVRSCRRELRLVRLAIGGEVILLLYYSDTL
jgi:hypothetical protein